MLSLESTLERYFAFIQNHPFLVAVFVGCFVAYFMLEGKRSGKKISPQQLGLMVNNDNAKVIDLRDPKDFETGHISASTNIPLSKLNDEIDALKKETVPIIFVCKMGTHAASAVQKLGSDNALRLNGGIMSWTSMGLPLVQNKSKTKKNKRNK